MDHVRPNRAGFFGRVIEFYQQGEFPRAWYGSVALGNGTQYRVGCFMTQKGVFVGVEGRGAYEFQNWAHKDYVQEKLNLQFMGDAQNLADFINQQCPTWPLLEPQGEYREEFCLKEDP